MRSEILNPLFVDLTTLKGVGPRVANALETIIDGKNIVELLWHFPTNLVDRSLSPKLHDIIDGSLVTIKAEVGSHTIPRNKRQPYKIQVFDETGEVTLVFFRSNQKYLKKILPEGEFRFISGRATIYDNEIQITHPEHVYELDKESEIRKIEPIYRLTGGLTQKTIRKIINSVVNLIPNLPEWHDQDTLKDKGWSSWQEAIKEIHSPTSEDSLLPEHNHRRRLAYDELLANQLGLLLIRQHMKRKPGSKAIGDGSISGRILQNLTYTLTNSQNTALNEIRGDMANESRMLRLLQGDVGSGKTVVAYLAMLSVVEAGKQSAIMAPTEILSQQLYKFMLDLSVGTSLKLTLLTGQTPPNEKVQTINSIKNGSANIIVGTHALFQESVEFNNLGLAVVDEQHRFGVHQRMALASRTRGLPPDILIMSATPIPRTLTMTEYGDIDVSKLTEKPPGRRPITTSVIPNERIDEVITRLHKIVSSGARAFWICPLVTESAVIDAAAAENRYEQLHMIFGNKVGLIHGKMHQSSRSVVMSDFSEGNISILVATTVVEVGVDVPEATVIVIEQAERFGLAQLHQLRGRVGRKKHSDSSCLLIYSNPLSDLARSRLNILRETQDGFLIAEEDLKLRGGGEILGIKQSGVPNFRIADLSSHQDLLDIAHEEARKVLSVDPKLISDKGRALRNLLYLFGHDLSVDLAPNS